MNKPIKMAGLRTEFQRYLGLETTRLQLLVRFGYAKAMPRSLRRPVGRLLL